ncbi:GTP 3',8-cyclase MoaA [Streptomyces variegatus]|uniref:GTP 3',8-cyclase MoaA n=1 Tax=Streptomyces variegatus TaxID=284040 RepID=UPI003C2C6785
MLRDSHGRVATDLRVSLTDRCNLRCTYCMPAEGLAWLQAQSVLTDEEVVRLVRIAVEHLGVREVRFTGGEPLLRPGLRDIVEAVAGLRHRPEIALTTNAVGLEKLAEPLHHAGLDRINVSLDTLDPETFHRLTRRHRHTDVLAGLAAADAVGMAPIKVNSVLTRGINDQEGPELLRWCLARGYELRFIEQMPLDGDRSWNRANMVTADEILERLQAEFSLSPQPEAVRGSAPAQTWLVDGGPARVGVIASVTAPFCHACDRTRLTADGQVRACLFSHKESDLRGPLRSGGTDEEIAALWRTAMWGKQAGGGIGDVAFEQPARSMSAIGG